MRTTKKYLAVRVRSLYAEALAVAGIALNWKMLSYEGAMIDLHGEQHLSAEYKAVNTQQLAPALDMGDAVPIQTSVIIGNDVHSVNNRRSLKALCHRFGAGVWCRSSLIEVDVLCRAASTAQPDAA